MNCSRSWGAIALSASERPGSGITSSGSTSMRVPSPSHSAQAPNGELNEKLRGFELFETQPVIHAREVFAEGRLPLWIVRLQVDQVDHDHPTPEP